MPLFPDPVAGGRLLLPPRGTAAFVAAVMLISIEAAIDGCVKRHGRIVAAILTVC
jgi:hypothetical protein